MAETTTTYWTDDGTIYYYDRTANRTQREPPAGYYIPFEVLSHQPWREYSDHRNVPFWENSRTGAWSAHMPEVYLAFKKAQEAPPGYETKINSVHRISPNRANAKVYQSFEYLPEGAERGGGWSSRPAGRVGKSYGEEGEEEEAEKEMVRLAIRLSLQESLEKSNSKRPATGKAPAELAEPVASGELTPVTTPGKCCSCFEEGLTTGMPCGHSYCAGCVAAIFIQAMELDTFDQPRCCGILLPLDSAGAVLGNAGLAVVFSSPSPGPGPDSTSTGKDPSSVSAGKKPARESKGKEKPPKVAPIECFICMSDYTPEEVFRMPCSHHYCHACLRHHFVVATTDETLYPPKCCEKEIPAKLGNLVLNVAELQKFNSKSVEFRTKDRLYCWYKRCSAFIEPTDVAGEVGECRKCRRRTCIHCTNAWHHGECPEDKNAQEMLKMAQRSGWKRCYNCRAMLELADGCNHMTCKCGAQFCYICGSKWKTCACENWQPENLQRRIQEMGTVERAEHEAAERVAREMEQVALGTAWARIPPPIPHMRPPSPPPYWRMMPPGPGIPLMALMGPPIPPPPPPPPPPGYHHYRGGY